MPQIIKTGGGLLSKRELPRIKLEKNTIKASTNAGRSWSLRCMNTRSNGGLLNLQAVESTFLVNTGKGLYYSTNGGGWMIRLNNRLHIKL